MLLAIMTLPANSAAETLDLTSATIGDLNKAIDAGTLSSEKLVELSLARIAAYDETGPAINAVLHLNPNAKARARELDDERARTCLLYTSPSPRDVEESRMPSSA